MTKRSKISAPDAENGEQFVITVAMDAFRLCIGVTPRNHSLEDVIRWMRSTKMTQRC